MPGALPTLGEDVFKVEALLAVRPRGRGREFLVRWQEYGADSDSWEAEHNIMDPSLIRAFERSSSGGGSSSGSGVSRGSCSSNTQQRPAGGGKRPASAASAEGVRAKSAHATAAPADSEAMQYLRPGSGKRSRVGVEYQAVLPVAAVLATPQVLERTLGTPDLAAQPPCCRCGVRAAWRFGRWWCASRPVDAAPSTEGSADWCDFEMGLPPSTPPLCDCGMPSAWAGRLFWCERGVCRFEHRLEPERPSALRLEPASVEKDAAQAIAAQLTACAHGPMNAWSFVAPSDCGLGLFARVSLVANQFICEYGGPRLPARLQTEGSYVLAIPNTQFVIDGASENSPFRCPRKPAIYANHSSVPNARLELWPALYPAGLELRQRMVIVASEPIGAGREVRINYEHEEHSFWCGAAPTETTWRNDRAAPPPPTAAEPVINRLAALQAAAAAQAPHAGGRAGAEDVPCEGDEVEDTLAWHGADGGEARLRVLVPLLTTKSYGYGGGLSRVYTNWAMVATHVPGRSGRECRDVWLRLTREAKAEAEAAESSDDGNNETGRERCVVLGCKRRLLRCHGARVAGHPVGCGEESHVLCVPCLERWFVAQNALRAQEKLPALTRRSCPVCRTELRAVRGEEGFHLGLQKLEWSWEAEGQGE